LTFKTQSIIIITVQDNKTTETKERKMSTITNKTTKRGRPLGSKNTGETHRRSLLDLSVVAFGLVAGSKLNVANITAPTVYRWLKEGLVERCADTSVVDSVVLTQGGIDHAINHPHASRPLPRVFADRYNLNSSEAVAALAA